MNKRPGFVALLVGWIVPLLRADPPPGYYAAADASSAAALRASLHAIIDDHTRFPYTSSATDTWNILELADEDPNNPSNILDVYRNASYPKVGAGNPNYDREHTWPNSYGFPDDNSQNYPYSDGHQLFLCNGSYNGSRGNKPFAACGGCAELTTEVNDGMGGGSGVYPGQSNWTMGSGPTGSWETWIGRRGDVARAQFYLDVRYEGGVHGITGAAEPNLILTDDRLLIAASNTGNNESVAYMGLLSALLQWHEEDPPDDRERHRNDAVFSFQGNRNPFIDHPEWAACVFEGNCGVPTDCNGNGIPDDQEAPCAVDADCRDFDVCTCDRCLIGEGCGGVCLLQPIAYGDANCDCIPPNIDDVLCALNGFASFDACPAADLAPADDPPGAPVECAGDGAIDLDDVLAVLDAFGGANPCAAACTAPCP